MENTQSNFKPRKIGKQPGTKYQFWCKNYTNVKMINKVLREKISLCCLLI